MGHFRRAVRLAGAMSAILMASTASAQVFNGRDLNTGDVAPGGATPNTTASRNAHVASLGASAINLITFESVALGQTTNIAPGVTLSYLNQDTEFGGVRTGNTASLGFNTTAGGSRFLGVTPNFDGTGSITFNFSSGITFFGAYVTSIQSSCGVSTVLWGANAFTLQDTDVNGCSDGGGIQWFGFNSATAVTSVTFRGVSAGGRDVFGVDDVIYGTVVPEPSTHALLATGLVALVGIARRRQRRA